MHTGGRQRGAMDMGNPVRSARGYTIIPVVSGWCGGERRTIGASWLQMPDPASQAAWDALLLRVSKETTTSVMNPNGIEKIVLARKQRPA